MRVGGRQHRHTGAAIAACPLDATDDYATCPTRAGRCSGCRTPPAALQPIAPVATVAPAAPAATAITAAPLAAQPSAKVDAAPEPTPLALAAPVDAAPIAVAPAESTLAAAPEVPPEVPPVLPPETGALELAGGDGHMTNGYGHARLLSLRGMAVTSLGVVQGELTQQSRFGYSGNYGSVALTHDFSPDYYSTVSVGTGNSPLFSSWRVDGTGYRKFGSERQYVAGIGAYYAKGNESARSDQGLLFTGITYLSGLVVEGGVRLNWADPGRILGPSEYLAATFGNDDRRAIIVRYEHAKETYKVLPGGPELVNFKQHRQLAMARKNQSHQHVAGRAGVLPEPALRPAFVQPGLALEFQMTARQDGDKLAATALETSDGAALGKTLKGRSHARSRRQNAVNPRFTGFGGQLIQTHRALRRLAFPRSRWIDVVLLPTLIFCGTLLAWPLIAGLWAAIIGFWANGLGSDMALRMGHSAFPGIKSIPYAYVEAAPPDPLQWWSGMLISITLLLATTLLPTRMLPLSYALRVVGLCSWPASCISISGRRNSPTSQPLPFRR